MSHNSEPRIKPKNVKKNTGRLVKVLYPQRKKVFGVIVASIIATFFTILSPKYLGDATSTLFESYTQKKSIPFDELGTLLLFLVGLYLLSSLFSFLQQWLVADIAQNAIASLRNEVNNKLSRLPLRYFDQQSRGDILSRAVNDIDNVHRALQQTMTQMLTSLITLIGILVMMLIISPILTLVVLLIVPLSFLTIRYVGAYSQKHFAHQQQVLGNLNGQIEEMFTGHETVKAYHYEPKALDTFTNLNHQLYEAGRKAQFTSGLMMPLMMLIGNLGFVFVSIIGGILVLNQTIRVGDVQAFIQYTQQFSQPLSQASGMANLIQSALASAERIFLLLDEEEEKEETPSPIHWDQIQGAVQFENVSFSYEPGKPIIQNLSLTAKEGQTIAIVGPTGAGKTTLINLLMRFYEPDHGSIRVGGMDLQQLSREQTRSLFAMVLQDTWLFSGTIRENIAYGRSDASFEEVREAARQADVDESIQALPEGYNTLLQEDATNLSQGQKQLLTIARAFLTDPKILILDEATSNVDTLTEQKIQQAMDKLIKGRTSFVIAHRLSTIQDADLIVVMKDGTIIEQGDHDQLLKQDGFYAKLYQSQFAEAVV